jgi:tetratricopeptide (TPR) repeat protein
MRAVPGRAAGTGLLLAGIVLGSWLAPVRADMSAPRPPTRSAPAGTAQDEYRRGLRARAVKDWGAAAAAFRRAVELEPGYADAWNGLGYALRNQGKYPESLKAYDEALRLRPDFPEALEYLGEAYVKLGRMDDARRVLDRLTPLDPARARELADAIAR